MFISLVDADNAPIKASLRQLGLDLLCTNRDLALSMPIGKRHTDFTSVVNTPGEARIAPSPVRKSVARPARAA